MNKQTNTHSHIPPPPNPHKTKQEKKEKKTPPIKQTPQRWSFQAYQEDLGVQVSQMGGSKSLRCFGRLPAQGVK